MSKITFGTDGIRGQVGSFPITQACFNKVGQACRLWLIQQNLPLKVAIGWDTRASGKQLAEAFATGFGEEVIYLGIAPTPAISFFTEKNGISLGVSITASHNPYTDNGLKLFKQNGAKLRRVEEANIENLCNTIKEEICLTPAITRISGVDCYLNTFKQILEQNSLKGKRIVLDTANGATTFTTLPLLQYLGANVIAFGKEPDGENINQNCGSEYATHLEAIVKAENAWLGFAHDGDGDRLVVIDETGQRMDGDQLLGLLAIEFKRQNLLKNDTLVVTEQSNSGLKQSLKAFGIEVQTCAIGDREVFYGLEVAQSNLGGENSGHIILKDQAPTGDGLRVLLMLLELAATTPLCERKKAIHLNPKEEASLRVKEKIPLAQLPHLSKMKMELEKEEGRIYLRYSGTENKLRFLVEANTHELCKQRIQALQQAASLDLDLL